MNYEISPAAMNRTKNTRLKLEGFKCNECGTVSLYPRGKHEKPILKNDLPNNNTNQPSKEICDTVNIEKQENNSIN